MTTALDALQRLVEGNRRFVSEARDPAHRGMHGRRLELVDGQAPFAIVLGCSDSRVPAEIVFDQGLGDLFVIRVAGNIVAPSQIGSVEFAAAQFGTRLVVVMGHTLCGAVEATLGELERPAATQSPHLRSIVDRIRPAVAGLVESGAHDRETLLRLATRANVRMSVHQLVNGSAILERMVRDEGLLVVGAEYALGSGEVDFFDGLPPRSREDPAC